MNVNKEYFTEESVINYHFKKETGFSDILHLKKAELQDILKNLATKFEEIEKNSPGAGYKVHFVKTGNKRPFEIYIESIGKREVSSEMEMPVSKECVFCKAVKENKQMEKVAQKSESLSRVLQSLEGYPLTISREHKAHWFKLDLEEQEAMFESVKKIVGVFEKEECSNYHIKTHIGKKGHQNIDHFHWHFQTGLRDKN